MQVIHSVKELKAIRDTWRNETVTLVPTMGALHAGHLSLIHKAKTLGTKTVVSIYVNPLQFGLHEDFDKYPRDLKTDLMYCREHGVDLVFAPTVDELHPNGTEGLTQVVPSTQLTEQLCGLSRPGHFTGVATIVLKLFNVVQPHFAVFGEKDGQQLAVIQHMVHDLNVPVEIVPAATVRDPDCVATSSRNRYLKTDWERRQARLVSRLLMATHELYMQGLETAQENFALAKERVLDPDLYPDFQLEYLAAVNRNTFQQVEILDENSLILVAAKVGTVRLIDNSMVSCAIEPGEAIFIEENITAI